MLPNVKILIQNGALGGLLRFAEGVAGIIGTGVSVADKIQIGTPIQVFNLQDAISMGVTEAGNPTLYRQVKEFYDEAGSGAELFIMAVADTMDQQTMLDKTNANGAVKLLNYAQGKIRLLMTTFLPPGGYTLDDDAGIDADVYAALTNGQALAAEYETNHMPVAILVEGRAFTGVASELTDLLTLSNNHTGVVLGGTVSGASSSVGLAVGRASRVPVQRKISRVKEGALPINAAYIGSSKVEEFSGLDAVHDKGFIVIRKFPTLGGYFFGGDHLATANSDDYCFLARRRVINKAHVLAYGTYVEELDDEVLINADGTLDAGYIKYMEAKIENRINLAMVANREISSVKAFVDPAQNVISTNKIALVLKMVPVGYSSEIEVKIGLENPALAA